jgi:hypothetical protein
MLDSRLEDSSVQPTSEGLRKVRLWGNQKGFKLEAKREVRVFAATLNRINDERDRFFSKSPLKQGSTDASVPETEAYLPLKPVPRLVKHMSDVDFSNVDIVFQQPPQPQLEGRINRRRSTVQSGLHFVPIPNPQPKTLYEPPPACDNIRKYLQASINPKRAKSELQLTTKKDQTEPSSPLKLVAKLPTLRKQPKKLSVVTTKSSSPLERRGANSPLLPSPLLPARTGHSFFKMRQVLTDRL